MCRCDRTTSTNCGHGWGGCAGGFRTASLGRDTRKYVTVALRQNVRGAKRFYVCAFRFCDVQGLRWRFNINRKQKAGTETRVGFEEATRLFMVAITLRTFRCMTSRVLGAVLMMLDILPQQFNLAEIIYLGDDWRSWCMPRASAQRCAGCVIEKQRSSVWEPCCWLKSGGVQPRPPEPAT